MASLMATHVVPRASARSLSRARAYQLKCRRYASSESAKSEPQPPQVASERSKSSHPISGVRDPQELLLEIQMRQRAAQARKFESPKRQGQVIGSESSFHPALAGFLGGFMLAFGLGYTFYHFSGSYHAQKASSRLNKALSKEQALIANATQEEEVSAQDVTNWLRKVSRYYSTFVPASEQFVTSREREIEKGLSHSAQKAEEVGKIAKECAQELEREVAPRNTAANTLSGLIIGRTGWDIVMKHLMRIEEVVEGKEFVEKRRQRAKRGIVDEAA